MFCPGKSLPEGGLGPVIGQDPLHTLHADHKGKARVDALPGSPCQLSQVPDPALRGRIGKVADAALLQGAALDLQKIRLASPAHPEVDPRGAVGGLRADLVKPARLQPLVDDRVGRLGVDVVELFAPVCSDEVVGGLSVWVPALCQDHLRPGEKELPEPPGVLDVDRDLFLLQ